MNLSIEKTKKENGFLIELRGEIDVYTVPKLKNALIPLTESQGTTVCVDLNEVTYLDSTGLGTFIHALKSATEHDSRLKLIRVRDRVFRLFEVTGLQEIMTIEAAEEVSEKNGSI